MLQLLKPTAAVATLGLDTIIALAAPIFSLAYAPCLVLMLLGILQDVIPNDGGFKGAMPHSQIIPIYPFLPSPEMTSNAGFLASVLFPHLTMHSQQYAESMNE